MSQHEIERFNDGLKAMYDDPMYRSMIRMWEENINLGYFETPDDDLALATERANARLAEAAGSQGRYGDAGGRLRSWGRLAVRGPAFRRSYHRDEPVA